MAGKVVGLGIELDSYFLMTIHLKSPYHVSGGEIPEFRQSLGVSISGWAYILVRLQTPYQVFGEVIPKYYFIANSNILLIM